MLAPT
jgi:hypothetical protein